MKTLFSCLILALGLAIAPWVPAQQMAEQTAESTPPPAYLIGTGVSAPGALMYRAPIAGQFLPPMEQRIMKVV